jgi:urease gamma subunit
MGGDLRWLTTAQMFLFCSYMNAATDIAVETAEPLDDGVERARARLRGLERAGEVGEVLLGLVEMLAVRTARIVEAAAEDDAGALKAVAAAKDLAQAYGKISRSIRQNGLLEEKLEAALRDRAAGLEEARRARALKAAQAEERKAHGPRLDREEAVAEVMEELIAEQIEVGEEADALSSDFAELLDYDESYEGYGDRPVSETVTRLCQALGLQPDWEPWARTDWARAEARDLTPGSPYVPMDKGGTGACVVWPPPARGATGPPG